MAPVLWTGLEYFRSELYYLRFAWINVGFAFWDRPGLLPTGILGVYGVGLGVFLLAGALVGMRSLEWLWLLIATAVLAIISNIPTSPTSRPGGGGARVQVAGVQLEFPPDLALPGELDRVLECFPKAEIIVLSEYAFDGAVPRHVREWCRRHRKHLVAGGKSDQPGGTFYNMAFVVGPEGTIVFEQAKSVPIQFFRDGLPAATQEVWQSPWGKIGICVCYDLSYRKVVDRLVAGGAQGLIVPFMDITEWGAYQHALHERVGPVRARESGVPVFRVGSSGVSQLIDADGTVRARAGFPGPGAIIGGEMMLGPVGRLPLDAWLAPVCAWITVGYLLSEMALAGRRILRRSPVSKS